MKGWKQFVDQIRADRVSLRMRSFACATKESEVPKNNVAEQCLHAGMKNQLHTAESATIRRPTNIEACMRNTTTPGAVISSSFHYTNLLWRRLSSGGSDSRNSMCTSFVYVITGAEKCIRVTFTSLKMNFNPLFNTHGGTHK